MKILSDNFTSPNGIVKIFFYREGTNDHDVITSCYCEDEYDILSLGLRPGDRVLDAGAHIGGATALMLTIPGVEVMAIEPLPENVELLKRNAFGAVVYDKGLWATNTTVGIEYKGGSAFEEAHRFIGNTIQSAVYKSGPISPTLVEVSTVTLGELVPCKFMKIDIEGAEVDIFRDTPNSILSQIERVHGEYHGIEAKDLLSLAGGVWEDVTNEASDGYKIGLFKFKRKLV